MAVAKRIYRTYTGGLTPERTRFLVLTRYALRQIFASKVLVALLVLSVVPVLIAISAIYFANNEAVRLLLNLTRQSVIEINPIFFARWLLIQTWIAMAMTAVMAPTIVSPELSNGSLPLFFSRPITRAEYVLGKFAALGLLLSGVTWIPGLLLYGLQVSLAPGEWFRQNWWLAGSIVASSVVWIALVGLLALAVAATVKWKIVATALTFAAFIVPAGFSEVFNAVLRTHWGSLVNLAYMMQVIFWNLFRYEPPRRLVRYNWRAIPVPAAWAMLLIVSLLCLMFLHNRLRAREVVRG